MSNEKYYVEIDYRGIYNFDGISGNVCHYTLFNSYEEGALHLDSEVVYHIFTPCVLYGIGDLRCALSKANKLFAVDGEEGVLGDYNEDCILGLDDSGKLVSANSNKNTLHLFEMGFIGSFSKEKTTTLRGFLSKYDFNVPPLNAPQ